MPKEEYIYTFYRPMHMTKFEGAVVAEDLREAIIKKFGPVEFKHVSEQFAVEIEDECGYKYNEYSKVISIRGMQILCMWEAL
jgi:hypothetical protein